MDNLRADVVFAVNRLWDLMADFDVAGTALFVATYTESESAAKGWLCTGQD